MSGFCRMSDQRMAEIAKIFAYGGYVTVYEADAFLRLDRGTCKEAAFRGELKFCSRPYGKKTRYLVRASDVERLYGVGSHVAHDSATAAASVQS